MLKPVLFAAAVLAAAATPAAAQYYTSPPPMRVEVPQRPSGEDVKPLGYWQPGQWVYRGNGQRVWVSGRWVDTIGSQPPLVYREVPADRERPMGYRYVPGYRTYD